MGNSTEDSLSTLEYTVHPHACGELDGLGSSPLLLIGSSPRLWGTRLFQHPYLLSLRFIPTLVGNSRRIEKNLEWKTVHPHACGELSHTKFYCRIHSGSSPRLWGTLKTANGLRKGERFIPTLVGNSHLTLNSTLNPPVHPHACGELLFSMSFFVCKCGSSPRLWGTPLS